MKCDEFLAAIEMGGWLKRWRALRHARGCPGCAAAQRELETLKREMARIQPLSGRERRMWERAAEAVPSEMGWRPWVWWMGGAVAALVVGLWMASRTPPRTVGPVAIPQTRPAEQRTVVKVNAAEELERLGAATQELEAELRSVRELARRVEAQRQVAVAIDRFGRW